MEANAGSSGIAVLLLIIIIFIICKRAKTNRIAQMNLKNLYDGLNGRAALSGAEFEDCFAELLRRNGYQKVSTTRASGDYGVDVIAYNGGAKLVFQCKWYSKNLGIKPVQEVYAGKSYYGADKAYVATNVYFTKNAINLANSTGVGLLCRKDILKLIDSAQMQMVSAKKPQKSGKPKKAIASERKKSERKTFFRNEALETFCPYCFHSVTERSEVCPNCGKPLK